MPYLTPKPSQIVVRTPLCRAFASLARGCTTNVGPFFQIFLDFPVFWGRTTIWTVATRRGGRTTFFGARTTNREGGLLPFQMFPVHALMFGGFNVSYCCMA